MLNAKQEKFVQNIVKGMSQRQAYKEAYGADYDNAAIDSKASALFNSYKVQDRYKELMDKLEDETIMSAKDRMRWLTKVVNGEVEEEAYYYSDGEKIPYSKTADISTKIKALDTLNKMSGEYVTKVEGNISVEKLEDLL